MNNPSEAYALAGPTEKGHLPAIRKVYWNHNTIIPSDKRLTGLRPRIILLTILALTLVFGFATVQAHPKQVTQIGNFEVTYFSEPQDPVVDSRATLFIQVRNITTGIELRVYHFVLEMIPPTGSKVFSHPFSNSTTTTFNQPGNWVLLFQIGLTSDLNVFDIPVSFVADVSPAQASGLLAAFATVLATAIPKSWQTSGHIVAVVLWLGMMLHVANTYWLSSKNTAGLSNFATTFRKSDIIVALAIGLLVLTGVLRAFAHFSSLSSLFGTDFGLVLIGMISMAGGMIGIGVFNRTYLLRGLERELSKNDDSWGETKACQLARRMFYLIILEIGLGVLAIIFGTVFIQIHTIS